MTTEQRLSPKSELIRSAVSFLRDSSINKAPLSEKIEFLQTKGLSKEEIEFAIKESQNRDDDPDKIENKIEDHGSLVGEGGKKEEYLYETLPPPVPERDWKDYFIMATMTAGLVYGLTQVTKRYVLPNILPPSKDKMEQDKDEIKSQFDKIERVLNAIEQEHNEFKEQEKKKLSQLDDTIEQLEASLDETNKVKDKMNDDFRMLKLEMSTLQTSIDKFMSNNNSTKELGKINNELTSLKNLIRSSGVIGSDSGLNTQPFINRNSEININSTNNVRSMDDLLSKGRNTPKSGSGVPGIDAIPTASDLIAKLKVNNNNSNSNNITEDNTKESSKESEYVPTWKKVRDENMRGSNQSGEDVNNGKASIHDNGDANGTAASEDGESYNDIPEWQKMLQRDDE